MRKGDHFRAAGERIGENERTPSACGQTNREGVGKMKAKSNRALLKRRGRPLRIEALEERALMAVSLSGQPAASATSGGSATWGGGVISDSAGRLYTLDPKSGATLTPKYLGPMGTAMSDVAFSRAKDDPTNHVGALYGVTTASGSATSYLYKIGVTDYSKGTTATGSGN